MKTCRKCKVNQPKKDFHKRSSAKDGLYSYCKKCTQEISSTSYAKKRGKRCAQFTEYHYKTNYNINYEDFLNLADSQNNCCKICKIELVFSTRSSNRAVLDHCHATGKIRGVLCNSCNRALGLLKESKDVLKSALSYLGDS